MKIRLPIFCVLLLASSSLAAPLRVHNQIVFTRDGVASKQGFFNIKNPREDEIYTDETVWTMDSAGRDQKRVWQVPRGYGQFGGFNSDGTSALSFNRFNLYVHDLSTKRIQRILLWSGGWGTYIQSPSFSPDGKQILCEIGSYNGAVYSKVLRLQSGQSYSVAAGLEKPTIHPAIQGLPDDMQWRTPCWSPDGKNITIVGGISWSASPASSKCQTELWTMNSNGTGAHQLTHNPAWDLEPTWSPDGQKIAFVRRMDTNGGDGYLYSYNLWVSDLKNHAEKQLTFLPLEAEEILTNNFSGTSTVISNPFFSPTGTQIVFEEHGDRAKNGHNVNGVLIKNGEPDNGIQIVDVEGKNQKRLGDGRLVQWVG